MHRQSMRCSILVSTLVLSACAARPEQPIVQTPAVVSQPPKVRSTILGLTASELVGHFGSPALQIREGVGLKLQFRSNRCVLDAFLYPADSGGGVLRVTFVDTRLPSGIAADQAACISALENPG
jgi:hypothetical protein